jgi:sulfite reductase (NADPH) flavoprotein alpha-component
MTQQPSIPFIPDNAPFTPSQRAWLNGFLAGMFCQTAATAGAPQPIAAAKPKLNVLFGSQSGNAESIAKRLVKEAKKQGYDATVAALERLALRRSHRRGARLLSPAHGVREILQTTQSNFGNGSKRKMISSSPI